MVVCPSSIRYVCPAAHAVHLCFLPSYDVFFFFSCLIYDDIYGVYEFYDDDDDDERLPFSIQGCPPNPTVTASKKLITASLHSKN